MEINTHLSKIVEELIADITSNVLVKVDSAISTAISSRLAVYDYESHIKEATHTAIEKRISEYTIDSKKLENRIVDKIRDTLTGAQEQTIKLVETKVGEQLVKIDIDKAISSAVGLTLSEKMSDYTFPPKSINSDAINFDNLKISGNSINGGIIENFSSVGIEDRASQIALTILDDVTVVENKLLTKDLTVEGSMTINGEFVVNGTVPNDSSFFRNIVADTTYSTLQSINENLFNNYNSSIFEKIRQDGLDLNKITLNGAEMFNADSLGSAVTKSNLQSLGVLKELQVSGESLLAQTLYVTPKRIGINTIEPSAALTVWDDEIEIIAKKKSRDVGLLGTIRQQKLVITSNNKDNIILAEDGSTQINDLKIGTMRFTTSNAPPNFVSERCHVVWNTNPSPGGPLGWICLGGANWANFGIID